MTRQLTKSSSIAFQRSLVVCYSISRCGCLLLIVRRPSVAKGREKSESFFWNCFIASRNTGWQFRLLSGICTAMLLWVARFWSIQLALIAEYGFNLLLVYVFFCFLLVRMVLVHLVISLNWISWQFVGM